MFESGGVVWVLLSCLDPNEKQPDEKGQAGTSRGKERAKEEKREGADTGFSARNAPAPKQSCWAALSLPLFPRETQPHEIRRRQPHRARIPPPRGRTGGGAIYHMKVRTGSRGGGQSARAGAAYIQREEEYGREADKAEEVVYTESGHMPEWADAEAGALAYWDAADLYERSNGRLYKSVEIALAPRVGPGPAAGTWPCNLPTQLDRRRAAALYPGDPRRARERTHTVT